MRLLLALVLLLCLSSASASATVLQVTVTGTIAGGYDQDGSVFGLGANGDPTGLPVTIVFRIDTALAPADASASPTLGDYRVQRGYGYANPTPDPSLNFITATWTVNGISRTSFLPNRDQVDVAFLSDAAPGRVDSISFGDGSYDGTTTTNTRLFYVTLTAILATDALNGDSLAQLGGPFAAQATSQSCGQCAGFWEDHTNGKSENANWFLAQSGISISYAVVPEPALLALLGAAGLALAVRRSFAA
ncbi:MAG: PEP-CTERM sorting domain-containing protein [Deltaproteobacteria bacterium]|nr:PEP-CTERM sorting domain-containing protein [Deltaproteobacteria bacterium]